MTDEALIRVGAVACARAIASGAATSEALVEACLERIEARDPKVRAWVHLDPERARAEARRRDRERPRGTLHGVPIGVKDIIDTHDFPTERGSALFQGRRPRVDAACVARLRDAGAIVLGKTVTTEFAFFAPGPTTHPLNPEHTPGGSSSGSAAAVADFQVPAALGTQTAGSIIRPASFCGVIGFKPSYGRFPIQGVLPLAPSLDTVGFFCRELEDVPLVASVLAPWGPGPSRAVSPRVAWLATSHWSEGEPAMRRALEAFVESLRGRGVYVLPFEARALEGLAELQNHRLASEALEVLGPVVAMDPTKVRPQTRELLETGARVPKNFSSQLNRALARARAFLESEVFSQADVILTPAAPGEAPRGITATGDPLFNRIWTLLGLPCLTLPAGVGPNGLPIGAQLVGRFGGDEALAIHAIKLSGLRGGT